MAMLPLCEASQRSEPCGVPVSPSFLSCGDWSEQTFPLTQHLALVRVEKRNGVCARS